MTMRDRIRGPRAGRLRRGVVVLSVVLLLHALAIFGVRRELALATPDAPTQRTLSIALLKPPPPQVTAPIPTPAATKTPLRTSRAPRPAPAPTPAAPAAEPTPVPDPMPAPPVEAAPPSVPEPPPSPAASDPTEKPSTLPPGITQVATQGRIAYRTTYTRLRGIEAMTYVDWSVDLENARYELWLRTVDPPGLLDLRSSGELKPFGIAPVHYLERIDVANRELSVDFDWSRRIVRFAGRGAGEPAPFEDGTQDPLSLQFHLPLLAQAYPWRFTPGALLTFQVARRKVESYTFAVDGFESMTIQGRVLHTLKIIRPKTSESNRGVEFWLAPDFDWIPVRLRFVDTNNEVWDSVIAHLPGTEPPSAPIQQEVVKP